ncbi:MAG: FHA domain-containing protein [Roseburia sp.]|nr:FHA domain-containing protein [Roseburia sp.]MCM1278911.1 FHA domain-containing protein [Robinsoniella sp.]
MQLKRCGNGHFYDGDKFMECPHCAENSRGQMLQNPRQGEPAAVLGSAYQEEDSVTVPVSAYQEEDSVTVPVSAYREEIPAGMSASAYREETSAGVPASAHQTRHSAGVPASAYQEEDSVTVPASAYIMESGGRGRAPLREAVQMAVGQMPDEDDGMSVGGYQGRGRIIDPVVGWLVCIEGADFGSSFIIKSGRNFVGRSGDMDIVLHGDSSISRVKHAIILYEPKRREFIAQAGESRELFYVNEEVVLNSTRLKQHDILMIGNTKLMFFPCCGENFSWDDYRKD